MVLTGSLSLLTGSLLSMSVHEASSSKGVLHLMFTVGVETCWITFWYGGGFIKGHARSRSVSCRVCSLCS